MYKHLIWEDQLIYHELQGDNSLLRIVPSRGGIISEWIVEDQPVLYFDKATLLEPAQNIRGGIPILFPICGPLQEGQYTWEGNNFQMKQHGLARNMSWRATKLELGTKEAKLTLETESTAATKSIYPFDFRLVFTYLFQGNRLTIQQSYKNTSPTSGSKQRSEKMPFYAGFHPYFYAPERNVIKLDIPAKKCEDLINGATGEALAELCLADVAEANYVLSGLSRNWAVISNLGTGRKITLEYASEFKYIVLWALERKNFLCFEPWMGNNYALNTGQELILLDPGQQLDTWITITVQ